MFWLLRVLIADSRELSQVIAERMKLRAMWIKEDCKGDPKLPEIGKSCGPNRSTKEVQNVAFDKRQDWASQQPPRSTRGDHHGRGGGTHGRAPATHCHAWPSAVRGFVFLSCGYLFSRSFSVVLPYYVDELGHLKEPNTSHSNPPFYHLRLE